MSIENPSFEKPKNDKDRLAENYDRLYSAEEPVFVGGKPEPVVEKIPQLVSPDSALDIARNGFEVMAVDLSEKGMIKLQTAADSEGLKVKTFSG